MPRLRERRRSILITAEEIANDPLHYQSTYARIKVLTEKGKTLATVELAHFPRRGPPKSPRTSRAGPSSLTGRLFRSPLKPEDPVVVKTGDYQVERKVLTDLPQR